MNKKISTLLCGVLALASFSVNAQQYLKIQTNQGELVKQGDSTIIVPQGSEATKTAASLWKVETYSRETSGNLVYKFTNKATNTTLKLKGEELFAVGEKDAVRHNLDTVKVGQPKDLKKLFTVEGGFTLAKKGGYGSVVTPDTGIYANDTQRLTLILAEPGDMTHWMTVAELNQCATYDFPLLAKLEGVDEEKASYEFISINKEAAQSTDYIFTIKSKTSGKFLAVDSTNVTKNSTVNVGDPRQNEVFGFKVEFGGRAVNNFGILFNPVNDSVAVAVMNKMLSWNVVNKETNTTPVTHNGEAVAWLGNARFLSEEVEFITVDSLYNPTNGQPYWADAPKQLEKGESLDNGLYILTTKSGKIWGVPYETVCKYAGDASNIYTNEYLPENQWMITSEFEKGIYSYKIANRFYNEDYNNLPIKKVETCEDTYFIFMGDTVSVKAIEEPNEGWKVFDGEELESSSFTLGLVNKLGAESAYMIMNEDSSLNVLATEEPLEFRAKFVRGDNFNLDAKGAKTYATDTLASYHLYTLNAKGDTLWVNYIDNVNNNQTYTLTTERNAQARAFYFKAENPNEYKMVFDAGKGLGNVDCDYEGLFAVRVHENGGTTTHTKTTNNDVSLFTINYSLDDAEYARLESGHYVIIDNSKGTVEDGNLSENEVLTMKVNGDAKFLSVGDNLGSAAAIEENFSLWIDEACVSDEPGLRLLPTYYIMKGAKAYAEGDSVKGNFLTIDGTYKVNNDSLVFKAGEAKINEAMDKVQKANNAFLFKITDEENQYTIHPAKNRKARLAVINGVVVSSMDQNALPVVVTKATVIPTANEGVEVSEVTVIAGEGQVTIAGAAGKKVVISNILGQVVANTVVASDNATIAAPAGVVVVAVEGEAAVKAIVK